METTTTIGKTTTTMTTRAIPTKKQSQQKDSIIGYQTHLMKKQTPRQGQTAIKRNLVIL